MRTQALDWAIIATVLAGNLIYAVFFSSRHITTDTEFYLGRRTTPWWIIGLSVSASYFSAIGFLGGPAWGYADGLSVVAISLNYPVVIFVVITIFLPFFFNSGCASIFEYQERRFGPLARTTVSGIFLFSQTLQAGAIVFAAASVCEFMTGLDAVWCIVIVTAMVFAYTVFGGTTAVIRTDVVQCAIFFGGTAVILYTLAAALGAPGEPSALEFLRAHGKLGLLRTDADPAVVATLWTGVFAMTLYHTTVYGVNQMIVQRALAAKTLGDAKKSYMIVGYSVGACAAVFPIIGVLLFAYYRGAAFEKPNTIIIQYALDAGIPGLVGITTVAVIAAAMSSLASSVNSLATISTVDFYQRFFARGRGPEHYLAVSRISTGVWAALIVLPAYAYTRSTGSVLVTLSSLGSYFVGAKLSMYGLGFYSKHTSERGLLVGVATGFVVLALVSNFTPVAWPWYTVIGAAATAPVAWGASILLDGFQSGWSRYSVVGNLAEFRASGQPMKRGGWYVVPGKIDRASWWLLAYFAATVAALAAADRALAGGA